LQLTLIKFGIERANRCDGVKVVQVVNQYPPLAGGGSYHVYSLARELSRKGVSVEVLTCDPVEFSRQNSMTFGAQSSKVSVFRSSSFFLPRTQYPVSPKLFPMLMRGSPDIIHAHGYQLFTSDLAAIVGKLKRRPLIVSLHGFPRKFQNLSHRLYHELIGKRTLQAARKLVSVSTSVANQFQAVGVPKEKIAVIPNGIDLEEFKHLPSPENFRKRFRIAEKEKTILAVGRLEEIKGFQHLIGAMPEIQAQAGPVKLIIAGPGFGYGPQLIRLAKERGVQDEVIFCGTIGSFEKLEALAGASVIAIPSIYEGFGVVLLEAMAARKPVVATRTGIAAELIRDEKNGLLVKTGDPKDLALKIIRILRDEKLSFSLTRESEITVGVFDWKTIAERIYSIYIECLEVQ
jgi:glycosyltransferase involved in cell wall biosynthesis